METPKDINGVRTELIMQTINDDLYASRMPTVKYNRMYMIVYKSLRIITKRNLLRCMHELDVGLIDSQVVE